MQGAKCAASNGAGQAEGLAKNALGGSTGAEGEEVLKRPHVVSGEWWRTFIPGVIIEDVKSRNSVRKTSISSHGVPELVVDLELGKALGIVHARGCGQGMWCRE